MIRGRRAWCKLLFVTMASVSIVLLAEGLSRALHRPEPVRRVYDPFAYRIPQPGLVDEFVGRGGERVTVRLNELGMRGPSIAEEISPKTLTLVFLGGSTTENYAYRREDTFPEMVGRELERRQGRPVRVLNAGMSAATTGTSLGRLQHQVLDLEPDLVVVMHAVNDLIWGFHPGFREDSRHLPRPATAAQRPRSYLLDWLRRRGGPAKPPPPFPNLGLRDFSDFPARRVFERNLRSMVAVAAAREVPVLLLTQATMYRETPRKGDAERFVMTRMLAPLQRVPDIATLARGMQAMNETTIGVARRFEGQAHVFDLAGHLPASWDLFYDECHFTRQGNARVTQELVPVFERVLSFPRL